MSVYIHNVYAHIYLEERGSETFKKNWRDVCPNHSQASPSSLDRSENVVLLPIEIKCS